MAPSSRGERASRLTFEYRQRSARVLFSGSPSPKASLQNETLREKKSKVSPNALQFFVSTK